MDTTHIEAISAELAETFQHYGAVAELHRKYNELHTLLAAIIAETYPGCRNTDPRGRYVKSGVGYRRLPDDLAMLINEAATLLEE